MVGAILRQVLPFIDAISNIELPPVFLWELRKAVAAGKKKALEASKANATNASPSRVIAELVVRFCPPANLRSSM